MKGFIYVLKNDAVYDVAKVGRTNDIERRLAQHNSGSNVIGKWQLVWCKEVDDDIAAENKAHLVVDKYRVNGKREQYSGSPNRIAASIELSLGVGRWVEREAKLEAERIRLEYLVEKDRIEREERERRKQERERKRQSEIASTTNTIDRTKKELEEADRKLSKWPKLMAGLEIYAALCLVTIVVLIPFEGLHPGILLAAPFLIYRWSVRTRPGKLRETLDDQEAELKRLTKS